MTRATNPNEATDRSGRCEHDNEDRPASPSDRPMSLEDIQAAYATYADSIHRFEWVDRLLTGRQRRRRFADVDGRVLDVACGTGTNFQYVPDSIDLVGIDISPEMLANARVECDRLERDVELHRMDAEALEFPDDSFDVVVSTFATCTFPDPVAALTEMARVCRPTGRILLVEHGRSSVGPIARFQEWRADAHYRKMGCRSTQEPTELVSSAGLSIREAESRLFGVITAIEAQPY